MAEPSVFAAPRRRFSSFIKAALEGLLAMGDARRRMSPTGFRRSDRSRPRRLAGANRVTPGDLLGRSVGHDGSGRVASPRDFGSAAWRKPQIVRSEIELAGLRLRHHAVEIPARRRPEMLRRLGRDDRDRDRRLLAAHGQAGLAPERFRDAELAAQPVRGIDDLRPGRGRGFADRAAAAVPGASARRSRAASPCRCRSGVPGRFASAPCPAFRLLPAVTGVSGWAPASPDRDYTLRKPLPYPVQDKDLVCRYIGGVRFPAPLGSESTASETLWRDRRKQVFQAFPRRTLPPLQALDAERHFLRPLDRPERLGQVAGVAGQAASIPRPAKPYSAAVSRIWVMPLRAIVARRRSRPHLRPLRPRLLGQPHEFRVARGDRREVEAIGFDDRGPCGSRLP